MSLGGAQVVFESGATVPSALPDPLEVMAAALTRAQSVLLTMHAFPDGDGLGSTLGLMASLKALGKQATVYNPHPVPAGLRFIPGSAEVVSALADDARFDVTVACDAGHPSRLGPHLPPPDRRGLLLNVDHHQTTPLFGDVNLIDPGAAAVGVLIFRLIQRARFPLTPGGATALFTSLVTDTGSFRYSNVDPEALRVAAALVEAGAQPAYVSQALYESQPLARLELLARVLPTIELLQGGRVGCITVRLSDCAAARTSEEPPDGFVSYPRSIAGVDVAVLFREEESGWRVSLRSKGGADVASVARAFGGGGHRFAAGCTLGIDDEADVRARVLAEVARALS
jgi:phosphoesterase RecJ-like protein